MAQESKREKNIRLWQAFSNLLSVHGVHKDGKLAVCDHGDINVMSRLRSGHFVSRMMGGGICVLEYLHKLQEGAKSDISSLYIDEIPFRPLLISKLLLRWRNGFRRLENTVCCNRERM